jgi:hypothetical protein
LELKLSDALTIKILTEVKFLQRIEEEREAHTSNHLVHRRRSVEKACNGDKFANGHVLNNK